MLFLYDKPGMFFCTAIFLILKINISLGFRHNRYFQMFPILFL